MRPRQRKLAEALGLQWKDFALISPDIWRKYLLDYESLGEASKYAGTLTGDEIALIDQKLDHYIGRKAECGNLSHLLIDRFRFDSFSPEPGSEQGSNLLTRFGHRIYLIFMLTPPHATVERAWKRGLQVGRYKAVDDLLHHNIEAFTGMPGLFFTWALRRDKRVHYEFLDNSVKKGECPRTVAFGCNGELNIIDFSCLLDIERYTKINIEARCKEEVYSTKGGDVPSAYTGFLKVCAEKLLKINFVDRDSKKIYARMENGEVKWVCLSLLNKVKKDMATRVGLSAMAAGIFNQGNHAYHRDAIKLNEDQSIVGNV